MADYDCNKLAFYSGRPGNGLHVSEISPIAESSFWSLVDLRLPNACWIWMGQREGSYGRFKLGNRRFQAHRFAYASAWGHCPPHLVVRHRCDTPLCVAPHHLELGSDTENMADKVARGRQLVGEAVSCSLLTADKVRLIRSDQRTAREMGNALGVGKSTIQKVRQRINWKHVD